MTVGGNGSGFTAQQKVVEDLEDSRWNLVDAKDAAGRLRAVMRQALAILAELEQLQASAHANQLKVQRSLGMTKLRERQELRVDGLTVSLPLSEGGDR